MRRIIFDSSFLMAVAERPTSWRDDITDAVGGFEPIILDCAREELVQLKTSRGRKSKLAGLALELASGFSSMPCGGSGVDEETMSAALGTGAIVATMDRKLAESLRAAGTGVVTLRAGRVAVT